MKNQEPIRASPEITCIVLAGGKSTRLRPNKIKETIGDQTLLERVLATLSIFDSDIIIVSSEQASLPGIDHYHRARIVNDIYPGKGSLGGIYTGLSASKTHYNLVVAGDMPFLNINLLKYMIKIGEGFDLVAYHEDDKPELLHALYSRNCLAPMHSLIQQSSLRIIGILPFIKVRFLTAEEIERFDPQHLSFFNINTEADLIKARAFIGGQAPESTRPPLPPGKD
jgi:molybdopterin-guanine dinucleotide biosynthesis protein A